MKNECRMCGNCKFYIDGKCGTDGEDVKPDHICYGYTEKEDIADER